MKIIYKILILFMVQCLCFHTTFSQTPTVIQAEPLSNLFDANSATNWVSSFTGETFPIDLEIKFGSVETVAAVMLQQPFAAALTDCKVMDFEVYFKTSASDTYPETPVFTGKMADNTTKQWFSFTSPAAGAYMLIRILSVSGATTTTAALSELGIRCSKKNGSIASSTYDKDMPYTWTGITWTTAQPYQMTGVNWNGKTLMYGDFYIDLFPLLGNNYDFTNTQINVKTGINTTRLDETVKVYPSVVKERLHVKSDNPIKNIRIYTVAGVSMPVLYSDGVINTSNFASGQYVVWIETEKGNNIQKIVK